MRNFRALWNVGLRLNKEANFFAFQFFTRTFSAARFWAFSKVPSLSLLSCGGIDSYISSGNGRFRMQIFFSYSFSLIQFEPHILEQIRVHCVHLWSKTKVLWAMYVAAASVYTMPISTKATKFCSNVCLSVLALNLKRILLGRKKIAFVWLCRTKSLLDEFNFCDVRQILIVKISETHQTSHVVIKTRSVSWIWPSSFGQGEFLKNSITNHCHWEADCEIPAGSILFNVTDFESWLLIAKWD